MTASEIAWETLKAVGGFAGFASTAYVLWDRFWQRTPSAVVLAQPLMPGSRNNVAILEVRNVADRPIIIAWERGLEDGFMLAKSDTQKGIMRALFPGAATAAIEPKSSRQFHLLNPHTYKDIDPDNVITLRMTWKFAQPIIWQTPRRMQITIRKSDLEALLEQNDE